MGAERVFYRRDNVGKCKYSILFHDGVKTHKDGSAFYDLAIFSNKRELAKFTRGLIRDGYREV